MITSLEEERVGLYACSHVFFFSVLFNIMINLLQEERVGLYACTNVFFSSSI